jgi:hypothetical protein
MESSNLQLSAASHALPSLVSQEAPFAQQRVWLTKQEHTQLKSDAAFWKAQHKRAVEREKALEKELEEAARRDPGSAPAVVRAQKREGGPA